MNFTLVALGLVKVAFGGAVAAVGILLAFRGLNRILGTDPVGDLRSGNTAAGLVHAASLLALGLLVHNAVQATFDAVDLTFRAPPLPWGQVPRLFLFALLHVTVSLGVGTGVLGAGVLLFDRMTPGLDELAEVRRGNVACALLLSAILVVLALLTGPGLQAALDGLIPFPHLPPNTYVSPR
ncbi:DUF350 domain-containing protein [Aggregicoccus sp. 17bor-14]|uniref:DUF350 domain-containing protein n=1 Tax=Myxococcaceae TaxID=31 RepID=UPI00129C55A3|nr:MULTISPECIES: DUF350 domain-containing protein [Myxococcaceae]MBF5042309.1 DUF350 domain-containing protein [Simulacricoccus sp. 17bor-14]MRI88083.1 DUF350 domain-containing protein [Aggregicoccus sp. 17bor-14]